MTDPATFIIVDKEPGSQPWESKQRRWRNLNDIGLGCVISDLRNPESLYRIEPHAVLAATTSTPPGTLKNYSDASEYNRKAELAQDILGSVWNRIRGVNGPAQLEFCLGQMRISQFRPTPSQCSTFLKDSPIVHKSLVRQGTMGEGGEGEDLFLVTGVIEADGSQTIRACIARSEPGSNDKPDIQRNDTHTSDTTHGRRLFAFSVCRLARDADGRIVTSAHAPFPSDGLYIFKPNMGRLMAWEVVDAREDRFSRQ